LIYNSPVRNSLFATHLTWQYRSLDETKMAEAAQFFLGEHDFSSFRAIDCQSHSPLRRVDRFTVKRYGNLVVLDITANAFLHHMVRNLAGVLIAIGSARRDVIWAKEVLEAKERGKGAETAPPYGLYLLNVSYPERFQLPTRLINPFILGFFNVPEQG
jgi:tRNA pseudouridine38-40 synthase